MVEGLGLLLSPPGSQTHGCSEGHEPELWVWSHVHHPICKEVGRRGQSRFLRLP